MKTTVSQCASFRYINAWASHPQFMDTVKEVWEAPVEERPIIKFASKLKCLKRRLRAWNRDTFAKVNQRVKQAEDTVLKRELAFEQNPTEANKIHLCQAKIVLSERLQIKELYWRQKANIKSIKEGDHNTKYFY